MSPISHLLLSAHPLATLSVWPCLGASLRQLCAYSTLQPRSRSQSGVLGETPAVSALPCLPEVPASQSGAGANQAAAAPHRHHHLGVLATLQSSFCTSIGSTSSSTATCNPASPYSSTMRSSFHTSAPAHRPQIGGYMRTGGRAADAEGHATEPRFLVTGACGQVGQEFVPFLRSR